MKGTFVLLTLAVLAVAVAGVGCTGQKSNSNPRPEPSGDTVESYVADLAGSESDDVTCEDDGVGDTSYFCRVDSGDPADCFHVFADGGGWSAYSLDGDLLRGPTWCPTG
jgi:hypothetical protein